MKITAKGNSAWLVLTSVHNNLPVVVRTRDIQVVEKGVGDVNSHIQCDGCMYAVKENYISILQALEVNIPTAEVES